jgi:acetyl-CoA carboxylase carboxyltransferase component
VDVICAKGAEKAAEFISFCDAFNIPVLTLANAKGFANTECTEKLMQKAAARLAYAYADATVPKVTVVTGKAYGSAYILMGSKAIGADMVFAFDSAEIGTMDPKMAAKILSDGADDAALKETEKEYTALQQSVTSAARRGLVDTIISDADTRKYVIGAFEMLYTKREDRPDKKHGTV